LPEDRTVDALTVRTCTPSELADAAAADAIAVIRAAITERGAANVMFATGNSQLAFLDALSANARGALDWKQVTAFHMDEYVGMGEEHPASFARYIRARVDERLHPRVTHLIDGTADPATTCERYAALVREHPLDLCVLGIGENGHLAFNDPPVADFDDPLDVKVVALDGACRRQQVGEGHFASIDEVPTHAVTVTIPTLCRARTLLAIVPERRKAAAVREALTGPVSTACPASFLRRQPHARLYLDTDAASLL
jgi:glucosamine-6-phosphate deaminase